MRTSDPTIIRKDYINAVVDVRITYLAVLESGLSNNGKKLVTEYSFLAAAILLEGYISDLFTAYINKDDRRFKEELLKGMNITADEQYAKAAKSFAEVNITKHLTQGEIRQILDPRDFNITFVTVGDMKSAAGRWLQTTYKKRFMALTKPQAAILVSTKDIRNFLAHRSTAARDKMQLSMAESDMPTALKRGNHEIHDVGSFLSSYQGAKTRIEQYLDHFMGIGTTLCP